MALYGAFRFVSLNSHVPWRCCLKHTSAVKDNGAYFVKRVIWSDVSLLGRIHVLLAIKVTVQTTYGVCPNMSAYVEPTQSVPGVHEFLYAFVTNLCKVAVWCPWLRESEWFCGNLRTAKRFSSWNMYVLAAVSYSGGKHVYTCTEVRETLQWYMNMEFTLHLVSLAYSPADWLRWFVCYINVWSGYKLFGIYCRSVSTGFMLIRS